MKLFAIGAPGGPARLIMGAEDADDAAAQLRAGEVALPVPEPGAYTIAKDGLSAGRTRVSDAGLWHRIRCDRFAKLVSSDETQRADWPISPEQKAAWATYRQALRDITTQADPANITWPIPPS
jgi:hypothetical protein